MNRTKYIGGCLFLLPALACGTETAPDASVIKLGATISRTGPSAVHTWGNAFELAASDANEGLRIAGYPTGKKLKFETLIADSKNDVNVTVPKAIELVQQQGAKLILNGTSSDSLALNKLAYDEDASNDLDVPIVCVACSSPSHHNPNAVSDDPATQAAFRNVDGWHFGLSMSSLYQSTVLWNIIADKTPAGNLPGDLNGDGVAKISTIAIDDPFGTGFQDALETVAKQANSDVLYEKTTHPKDADVNQYNWSQAIDVLTDDRTDGSLDVVPDVLVEFTFPNFSLALVKAYTGLSIPFMHTHSMRERTVLISAGSTLDGHEGTSYEPLSGTSGDAFDGRFRDVLGIARQSQWDAHVYDGAFLFSLAAVKATRDLEDPSQVAGSAIRDAMLTLNDPDGIVIRVGPQEFAKAAQAIAEGKAINYEGASGPCDFDSYGRARNRISHWLVEDGADTQLGVYDCVTDDSCPKQD